MPDRRIGDRRDPESPRDRRWFFPDRIENRGKKSLPFTTKEPDFVPTKDTIRRRSDAEER